MRTFLVAICAAAHEDVVDFMAASTKGPDAENPAIDSWWVAEDDRTDGSDTSYDSAIFVPRGSQRDMADRRDTYLSENQAHWDKVGYPFARTDTSGQWYLPPSIRPRFGRENYTGHNETPTNEGFIMTNTQVHDVTDLPKKTDTKSKIKKGVAIGIFAAGALLLVTDVVNRFRKDDVDNETQTTV